MNPSVIVPGVLTCVAAALLLLQDPWPHAVVWDVPAVSCPDQLALRQLIRGYLGDEVGAKPNSVRVVGTVSAHSGRFQLELEVEAGDGRATTTVSGKDCEVLARVAALKVAMAVDPLAVLQQLQAAETPEPEPGSPSPPAPASQPEPSRTKPAPAGRSIRGLVRAEGGVGAGVVPGLGAAVAGAAGIHGGGFRVELEGRHWFGSDTPAPQSGSVEVSLTTAALSGCAAPTLADGRLEVPLCVGLGAGAMVGRGRGVPRSRRSSRPWMGVEVGSGLAAWVHPMVAIRLSVAAVVPLVRPGFELDSQGTVYRTPPAAARAGLGVELRFP